MQTGRGLASCLVVLHHISGKLAHAHPEVSPFFFGIFDLGWIGVDFFFVLSGFIIAHTLTPRPSARDFLTRRMVRIYPPFWIAFVATLLATLMLPAFRGSLQGFSPAQWIQGFALLPSGQSAPVIGVAWTLHHEVLFYALAGLWLIAPLIVCAIAAVLLLTALYSPVDSFPGSFFTSPLHWEFIFGIIAYHWHRRVSPDTARKALIAGLAWMLIFCSIVTPINDSEGRLRVLQFGLGFGMLTFGSAALEWTRASMHEQPGQGLTRIGERLGEWSFALYLLHNSVILATLKVFSMTPLTGHALIYSAGITAFITSVITAGIYFTYVERPLIKKLLSTKS